MTEAADTLIAPEKPRPAPRISHPLHVSAHSASTVHYPSRPSIPIFGEGAVAQLGEHLVCKTMAWFVNA